MIAPAVSIAVLAAHVTAAAHATASTSGVTAATTTVAAASTNYPRHHRAPVRG